jgi:hypothetical protein
MIKLGDAPVYVINDFLSAEDIAEGVKIIEDQEKARGRDSLNLAKVFGLKTCSETDIVVDYIKRMSDKVIVKHDAEIVTQSATLGIWYTGSKCPLHTDNPNDWSSMLTHSSVVYLNNDFSGGTINFPEYNVEYAPKIGDLVIFKADIQHEVTTITSGKRYTLALWHTTNMKLDMFEKRKNGKG